MPKQKDAPAMIRETENGKEKWCSACKAYHPATKAYFYHDSSSKYKLTSSCKKSQKAANKKNRPVKDSKPCAAPAKANPFIMMLDLSGYEDLHADILAAAEEEFRTPELQVLWWISNRKLQINV